MVAPLRELPQDPFSGEPKISQAGRRIAAMLLAPASHDAVPAVPAWQAWLLAVWLVVTATAYLAITLGIWRE